MTNKTIQIIDVERWGLCILIVELYINAKLNALFCNLVFIKSVSGGIVMLYKNGAYEASLQGILILCRVRVH